MLRDEAPEEPAVNNPHAMRDTYLKWLNDHMTMRCMIRTIINDKLNHKFKDAQSDEMIQILNEFLAPFRMRRDTKSPT